MQRFERAVPLVRAKRHRLARRRPVVVAIFLIPIVVIGFRARARDGAVPRHVRDERDLVVLRRRRRARVAIDERRAVADDDPKNVAR
jgi:hypothetical protein